MGWSAGTFTRSHDWTADAASDIDIEAVRMDQEDDNLATGINNCLTKDGQNSPTSNLPMGGNRHTGVGNATVRDNYASVADVQDQDIIFFVSAGSSNTYTGTIAPAIAAYEEGQRFVFRANHSNTGAATLNLNSIGAFAIQTVDGSALASGMLVAGGFYEVTFDDNASPDRWVLTSPHSLSGDLALKDTINNADWSGTDLSVANGGTGASTLTGLLSGNGTSAITGSATINNSNWAGTDLSVANGGTGASTLTGLLSGNGTGAITGSATINNGNWLGTDLSVANGGTGASTLTGLLSGNGTGAITGSATINDGNWSGTDLAVANGGTGASTAAAAATALGVGTGDSPQFTGVNIGHASDTTITRDAAGQIAVEGAAVFTHNNGALTSAKIFLSTSDPSGGANGDIWLKHEA